MIHLLDMRSDVQEIFRSTPHEKQVMMFSATLSKEIRVVCKKFMQDVNIVPSCLLPAPRLCVLDKCHALLIFFQSCCLLICPTSLVNAVSYIRATRGSVVNLFLFSLLYG